ncbi:hypothetical protein U8607_24490 [Methylobacterium durans]|uniref:hypothetical protein n=1 Tax=Methylobacterium durans TaxID=2202825 RepID=UPI002AFE73DA|nr:hypothetical protein [Methylobacterium durans]MEA1835246.1 hypothetical protein [Methylobacterium durans]
MARRTVKPGFAPFSDETGVQNVGDLSIENGTRRIALHGSVEITRDRAGLAQARDLKRAVDAIVRALGSADLPESVGEEPAEPTRKLRNPFA